jgi:hypothetical protein
MLHPGLRKLFRLRLRASLRGFKRNLKSPTRVAVFILGLLIVVLWAGSILVAGFAGTRQNVEWFEDAAPFFVLVMLVISMTSAAGERAIYFSPSEIDFLFGGPFTRRQLLAYKMVGTAAGVSFSALIFSVVMTRYVPAWGPGYVGLWLALGFVQLSTMAILLVSQSLAESAITGIRKTILACAAAAGIYGAWSISGKIGTESTAEVIASLREETVLRFAIFPVEPFVKVMFADPFWPAGAMWVAISMAINGALCGFIFWLDAEYRESAISVSQRWFARIQSARRTGVAPSANRKAWGRAPRLPYWGGAGPIARRQLTTAMRNSRSMLVVTGVVAVGMAIALTNEDRSVDQVWVMLYSMTAWLTILLTMMIRFDFRSDLDQMEGLKALPIPGHRVAMGQLIAPVFVCLVMQAIIFTAGSVVNGRPEVALAAAVFVIPVNVLLFGVENIVFLLFPSRVMAFNPGDFMSMGRQMLLMFLKFAVIGVAAILAAVSGVVAYVGSGESWMITLVTAWLVLIAQAMLVLPGMAWAFNRFDVSADLPAQS